jgi:hypothetical protein
MSDAVAAASVDPGNKVLSKQNGTAVKQMKATEPLQSQLPNGSEALLASSQCTSRQWESSSRDIHSVRRTTSNEAAVASTQASETVPLGSPLAVGSMEGGILAQKHRLY